MPLSEKQRIGALSIRMDVLARLLERGSCTECRMRHINNFIEDALDDCEAQHYRKYINVIEGNPTVITVPRMVYDLMSKRVDNGNFRIIPWTMET